VVDALFEGPTVSASEIQQRFGVSHPTASQALQRLEQMHILEETTGRQRNRRYLARAILQIVE
jgi:Fic family protein